MKKIPNKGGKVFLFYLLSGWITFGYTNLGIALNTGEPKQLFAYVACEDKRIYKIDLLKNKLINRTEEIIEIGRPTTIDIDPKNKKLFVGSERGHWQKYYSPIVALEIGTSSMKVSSCFDLVVEKGIGDFIGVFAVYEIRVSPDGNELYVGYAHPKYSKGSTIVNSRTGKIIKGLNFHINKGSIFSSTGREVCNIWPGGSKEIALSPGKKKIKRWEGGIAVYDIVQNKRIILQRMPKAFKKKSTISLNPPWEKIKTPLSIIEEWKILKQIDRDNGDLISVLDLKNMTKGLTTSVKYPTIFSNGHKAIIPMIGKNYQGYVVIIDLKNKKITAKIEVGRSPTNIVLSEY
jgi:DNA-binding beta-propeller fold protein YncE